MTQILENNHKNGINQNNIKLATVTEPQTNPLVVNQSLTLSPIAPIVLSTQVYQVDKFGNKHYPDHPECCIQSHIFCKVTVTLGAKFKTISKALLKIPKYGGDASGKFGVYPASENMFLALYQCTNYLNTVTKDNVTYAVIDITNYVKSGEPQVFYVAIKSEDNSILLLENTATVEISYVEDDDVIPSGKLRKNVGNKGEYAINVRNGKLQYRQQIFASKGGLQPFCLSLSYNATNCNSSSPNGVANGLKGWTLNYQQSLKRSLDYMLFVDSNNVVHTFKHPANNSSVWYDSTDKSGMVLVATDTGYSMTDGQKTTLNFDTSKRLVSIEEKLSDSKTVTTAIEYSSDGKISKVTDGLGDAYNFVWTDTLIQVKKEVAAEDTVSETLLAEITLASENIAQIRYALSGDVVDFAYDEDSQLVSVVDSASQQKTSFEYNAVGGISAVKNYVRNVDEEGQITDVPTDSNHFDYNLLQTRIANCRNSDVKSNAYCTMAYLFAEDGELLTTAEVKSETLQPLRYRTKKDFEKSFGTIPDKFLAQALFDGEETIETTATTTTSDAFVVDTSNQVFNTYTFTAAACITSSDNISNDGSQKLTVQIWEGAQLRGSAEFDPSKRETEIVCGNVTLSQSTHTLNAKLVATNLKTQVSFGHVKLYSTQNGIQKYCVNVNTNLAQSTENDGSTTKTWYEQTLSSLHYGTTSISDVIFTANDYALTLISRLKTPTAFNVWYNDGKNMLYQVSEASLTLTDTANSIEDVQVCTVSSTSGRTIFEYAVPDSTHLYKIRNVTTNTNNSSAGAVAEQLVNSNFQTVKTVDEHGVSTEYTYNINGSVTKVVTKAPTDTLLNVEESSAYHDSNLLKSSSHRRYLVDYTQSYAYGNDYELTQETQPNTQQINFAYASDKLASISSTLDSQTSQNNIAYDGDLVGTLNDTRTVIDFDYDERHNVSQVKIADAVVLSKVITYNENGTTQSETTYGNGQKIQKCYDKFDRLVKISNSTSLEQKLVEYVYNDTEIDKTTFNPATFSPTVSANSPLRVVVDHVAGTTTWYTYDRFGQLEKTENQNLVTTRTRDDFNRVASVDIDLGGNNASTTYTYASSVDDTLVAEETVWNTSSEISTTYSRDSLQRLTETTVMMGSNGYKQTFEYVLRQKKERVIDGQIYVGGLPSLTMITTDVGTTNYVAAFKEYSLSDTTSTLVRSDTVEYDANGNITKYGNVTYEYDKLNRLTRENNPTLDKTTVWDYDVSGNIVSRTEYAYTTDTVGIAVATYNYTYGNNWKDQLTSYNGQSIVYDQAGNPTTYKGATLTWERGRNMETYHIEDDDRYFDMYYDAGGKRISKRLTYEDPAENEVTTYYIYNGNNLACEKVDDGGMISYRHYLYNSQGVIGYTSGNTVYTYRKNLFGDITAIYQGATKVAEYAYDAWGNCTIVSEVGNIGTRNPFRYRGYYWDNDLQLYYLQTRYYDPQTGRFINADSLEYLDPETIGGLNLYAYCGNNPVMYNDPKGTFGIGALLAIALVSLIIGGSAQLVSNAMAGKEGDELWRGVAGAALGSSVNAVFLCITMPLGTISLFISAAIGSVIQTSADEIEKQIRGEEFNFDFMLQSLIQNFATTSIGNILGEKAFHTNNGWFRPKKFISMFTKPYGQKLIQQSVVGGIFSGLYNLFHNISFDELIRKFTR